MLDCAANDQVQPAYRGTTTSRCLSCKLLSHDKKGGGDSLWEGKYLKCIPSAGAFVVGVAFFGKGCRAYSEGFTT
ncbi:predicted protein [Sclerotinia sclerotiorum 1980 UF-70]|uniref:Uncharacterized protein n=2 Tax=Sclerotinia sclerotiorum (strain ATCC 18683 / 1980 / Ss-1) TaxID=665079 RepID=A7E5D5_SCLS1|nr:predicted protein [Sclerotinia sclerotiorum 1980 UF-70]APA07882.1 hypothetical protein sscle_03g026520 [Sclerotinia sclerotiorum 1980 UF-70]EDN91107.1 predicted protein [Sclerotinia sclerotiorum 1980 UF-70]